MAMEVTESVWDNKNYGQFIYSLSPIKWKNVRMVEKLKRNNSIFLVSRTE